VRRKRTFKGGYTFGRLAGSPKPVLKEAHLPHEVVIPLRQGFGEEVLPSVKPGEKVKAGQVIGIESASCSSPVHATVNGVVKDVCRIERFRQETGAVVIESDGSNDWSRMDPVYTDFRKIAPDEMGRMLYVSGVASLGLSGFPTSYNSSPLQPDHVDSIIINAVNSEPFAPSNEIMLVGKVDKFLDGVEILRRALPGRVEAYVGIDDGDKEIIKEMEKAADWLHIHPLKPKYPQGHDVILVKTILGREDSVSDVRAVVLDVQSVLHAYEAVVEGKPVIERIVALGGSGFRENVFFKVRIGTRLEHVVKSLSKSAEIRYICGGIMTGVACDDLSIPLDRTVNCIVALEENRDREFLSFLRPGIHRGSFSNAFLSSLFSALSKKLDTNVKGEYRPCIYCNYCETVCPVGLMPYLLSKYVTRDMTEEAERHRISACIECGLCTYVCPSKIPLMKHIQEGKARDRVS
jgi:electron transport complex protein RnfC